jgi:triosephosphate isomerase
MRRPIYFACWKANKTTEEVLEFYKEFATKTLTPKDKAEIILAPSPVYLEIAKNNQPKILQLGAQDVCDLTGNGRMGEVTAKLLSQYGVKYCCLGHRERRDMGETDAAINKKIRNLQEYNITPVLFVDENLQEYEANLSRDIIRKQLVTVLAGIQKIEDMIICYRPSWTIGTGYNITDDFCDMVADYIRKTLVQITDNPASANACIIYGGGTTNAASTASIMKQANIDGVYFIGAALDPDSFVSIVNAQDTPAAPAPESAK